MIRGIIEFFEQFIEVIIPMAVIIISVAISSIATTWPIYVIMFIVSMFITAIIIAIDI